MKFKELIFISSAIVVALPVKADSSVGIKKSFSDDVPSIRAEWVSIQNMSQGHLDVWINGNYESVESQSTMYSACRPSEQLEIQVSTNLYQLTCGQEVVVTEE